jgi:N-acetylmuramoyl-L-alanine amidase
MRRLFKPWLLSLIGSCGVLFASLSASAPPVTVRDVRVWAGPDATRLVLDLSGPVDHKLLTLQNPDRIVIDIASARLDSGAHALPESQGFVKQLRVGPQGGDLRVVIDLAAPAEPRSFSVEPNGNFGYRLVVDLAPAANALPTVVKAVAEGPGRDLIIAVDAGHGGQDPGSIGRRGTYEKDVTLAIARRLKARIDKEPGMRAILTRDSDYFLPLRERMVRARKQQADMFISVHADAFHDRSVAGSSVYVLSARGATDEAARWLAERENAADMVGGISLDDKDDVLASVLLDLSQSASMSASIDAADNVLRELDLVGTVRRSQVQQARFVVLKSPDIPSMLVETAFISNPGEELKLTDAKHQQRLAEAILAGVRTYFYASPPPGTRISQLRDQANGPVVASANAGGAP